jgi:hypothetical protein
MHVPAFTGGPRHPAAFLHRHRFLQICFIRLNSPMW